MGAYENPTYYSITQDYTAFNKAMMGTFDRYMAMYMQMQKSKTEGTDPNQDYYKLFDTIKEIPENLDAVNADTFSFNGSVRKYLQSGLANEDDKRKIYSFTTGVKRAYDNINDYYSNPEEYSELDLQTKRILAGMRIKDANGKKQTDVITRADKNNPWGNIYFNNGTYGEVPLIDIGNRLGNAKRDLQNENFGRSIIKGLVPSLEDRIENWQNTNQKTSIDGEDGVILKAVGLKKDEENGKLFIDEDADNKFKIGENWAGYWFNEMEDKDKVVEMSLAEKAIWLKVKNKYPGVVNDNEIDLSMFGFSMVDFEGNENHLAIIKSLRDKAIRKSVYEELKNTVQVDAWSPAGLSVTESQKYTDNFNELKEQVTQLALRFSQQPKQLGPVNDDVGLGASGLLQYIRKNKYLPLSTNKFYNFEITENALNKYMTGEEGKNVAEKVIRDRERLVETRGRDIPYADLSSAEKGRIEDRVAVKLEQYENAKDNNRVFDTSTGETLSYKTFQTNLINEIFNGNKWFEKLNDPTLYDESGTQLPTYNQN